MIRVHDKLAASFLNEGVGTCFAPLGDANMNRATRMTDGGCRMIHVRHEHCADAAAMGVAAARPDARVVLFDGDGSVIMHVQEIETMLRAEGLDDGGAVFGRPDFAAIARGFGAAGHRVEDLGDLPGLIADITGVTVWDFPVNDRIALPVMHRAHPPKGAH